MSSNLKQFLAAVVASIPNVLFGALMAWPSYTLKLLTDDDMTPLTTPLTPLESSLVGSLPPAGALLGTALAPALLDMLGRRNGALVVGLPYIMSWCLLVVARGGWLVLCARIVGGIGGGATLIMSPVFISEVAEERIRGALASTPVWAYCAGVLVSYALGWLCEYRTVLLANLSIAVLYMGLMALMKETPVYLLKRNKDQDALVSLAFYRAGSVDDKDVLTELSSLRAQLYSPHELSDVLPLTIGAQAAEAGTLATEKALEAEAARDEAEEEPLKGDVVPPPPPAATGWRYLKACAASRRALLLGSLLVGMQSWMGMLAVQVYAGALFAATVPQLSPDLCSVLLALVMMLGAATAAAVVDRAGRRVLMIWLSLAVALCLACLGSLLQWGWAPAWVIPLNIFLYCFIFNVGPGTVPFVLLAELFVPEVQGVCTSLAVTVLWVANSVLLGMFPMAQAIVGAHGVFYAFAGVAALAGVLSACMLPETRGLSPRQLQRLLS